MSQVQRSRILICLLAALNLVSNVAAEYIIDCSKHENQCRAELLRDGDEIRYDITCDCTPDPGYDVSYNLNRLVGNMCISKIPKKKQVKQSSLLIRKCSVAESYFPTLLLRDLKSSKNFSIFIEDATSLRLQSHRIPNWFPYLEIHAHFKNSHIYGLGRGWFTNATYVDLVIQNCTMDVMESHLLADYIPKAEVHFTMEASDVKTIKKLAFMLPPNSFVKMNGGSVEQWERFSFQGGMRFQIDAIKVANLQTRAININGMDEFSMTSSIFANIEKTAIVETVIARNDDDVNIIELNNINLKKVVISRNKFIKLHCEAFAGFCSEEELQFEDNFFFDVNPKLILQTKVCSRNRNWNAEVKNNHMRCEGCFSSENLNEEICALYKSAFCLCGDKNEVEIIKPFNGSEIPCRSSLYDHLNQNCQHDSGEIIYNCTIMSRDATPAFNSHSVYNVQTDTAGTIHCNIVQVPFFLLATKFILGLITFH